ncbi:Uncharacterised protein [uncultured archaeon]|nr:Uncharacterised protein [uncultured archaeon]
MITRSVQETKGSLYVLLPKQLCDALGINKGHNVNIGIKNDKIVIAPARPSTAQTGVASKLTGSMPA